MNKVVLLLGGNIGNVKRNFNTALDLISQEIGNVSEQSSLYQSKSWGFKSEDIFLNQVIIVNSEFLGEGLLQKTQAIEQIIGRKEKTQNEQYASRLIDIDILFIDQLIIDTENLIVPHPRLHLRHFTLAPLCELIPEFIHPKINKSLISILNNSTDNIVATKVRL